MISYKEWGKPRNDHKLSNYQISPRLFLKKKTQNTKLPCTCKIEKITKLPNDLNHFIKEMTQNTTTQSSPNDQNDQITLIKTLYV